MSSVSKSEKRGKNEPDFETSCFENINDKIVKDLGVLYLIRPPARMSKILFSLRRPNFGDGRPFSLKNDHLGVLGSPAR
jgi:tRNA1(Val) A37 N6-methylase TrmN6